jgi:class III cytochrome C family protein
MRRTILALLAVLLSPVAGAEVAGNEAEAVKAPPAAAAERKCSDCHISPNPTKKDPGLAPCPRLVSNKGPEVVLLDRLSSQYVPVVFAHRLHAEMTQTGDGCVLCHHNNSSEVIEACSKCHDATASQDLAKPSLKGAYHRQCLNCHREWSHETECVVCHAKKAASSVAVSMPDPTDIMGRLHPNAQEPVEKIYETKHENGRLVTFRHQEHVKRFGFKCVSCHHEQNCNLCHKPEKPVVPTKTFTEHHSPCSNCHEATEDKSGKCSQCHADQEIPPFSHEQTGLVLDKNHETALCVDCHVGSRFDRKPTCSECHEEKEKVTYPEKLPGTKTKTP